MDSPTLTHAHDGGTVHNHEGYSAEQMTRANAAHTHTRRDDWIPAWRRRALDPDTARASDLTGNLRP